MFNNWLTFSTSVFSDARKILSMVIVLQMELLSTQINAGDWTSKGAEIELKAFAKKCKHYVVFFVNATFDRKINTLNRPGVLTTNFQEV
jgi:hypothetical protein